MFVTTVRWVFFFLDVRTREWGSQRVTSDNGTGSATTLLEFIGDSVRASSHQVDLQVHESMLPWILNYTLQSIETLPLPKNIKHTMKLNLSNGEVWMDWPLIGYADMPIIQKFSAKRSWCLLPDTLISLYIILWIQLEVNFFWDLLCKVPTLSVPGMLGFGMNWH